MTTFRMMLLGTAAVGLTAAAMSTASAGEVEKAFAVSGHVNRVIVAGDDGKDGFVMHNDNSGAQSRLRGVASAKSESLTTGATIEFSATGGSGSQHANGTSAFAVRHSFLSIGNNMGTIRMGHTGHANNGHVSQDASGTTNAGYLATSVFGGVLTHTSGSAASAAGTAVGSLMSDHTIGRTSGISYDTPDLNGFTATVSHTNQGSGGIQANYSADYDGVAVNASAGYTTVGDVTATQIDSRYGGSLSIGLANGLSLSGAYGKSEADTSSATGVVSREDPTSWMARIGYTMSAYDMGSTSLSVLYGQHDDIDTTASNADELTRIGVHANQNLDDYGTSIYGGYEHIEYDTNAANFDDIDGVFVGVRVNF